MNNKLKYGISILGAGILAATGCAKKEDKTLQQKVVSELANRDTTKVEKVEKINPYARKFVNPNYIIEEGDNLWDLSFEIVAYFNEKPISSFDEKDFQRAYGIWSILWDDRQYDGTRNDLNIIENGPNHPEGENNPDNLYKGDIVHVDRLLEYIK